MTTDYFVSHKYKNVLQFCVERYFQWDDQKADINFRKHGIGFVEAARVFDDPLAVSKPERIESGEQRWQTIGLVEGCLLLLVAHTIQFKDEGTEWVRIISGQARRPRRKKTL